jgi:hypothetical protein
VKCWKCGTELPDPPRGKLPFRALCDKCLSSLHCCRNCRHFKPGMPNDCLIPGTEYISDREATNFCEEFHLLGQAPLASPDPKEVENKLFGENTTTPKKDKPKTKFDNLFRDD